MGDIQNDRIQIKAELYSDKNRIISHKLGVIGLSRFNINDSNFSDVIDQWGKITWTPEGVYIGKNTPLYFISESELRKL
ncbi:hypothetical protein [Yokenella regensburgei]|uniref:hypothetical protein n=1 Tax=Yokenella regensburgei TaxID=158877 RepID=UPI003F5CE91D